MSLKYALLGFINVFPDTSGYDLSKWFRVSVQYYWPATQSQIYRTLDELIEENLVSTKIIQQERKPNKKVFSITDNGCKNLTNWLKTPTELPVIRHELLLKLSYASILPTEEIVRLLQQYKEEVLERVQSYRNNNQKIVDGYASEEMEKFLWQLCLDSGFIYYQGELQWLDKAITWLMDKQRRDGKDEGSDH